MTNEEKAIEIRDKLGIYADAYYGALEMAQWKDEQFEKEKQQLIDKACKLMQHWILEHDYVDIMELEDYIKQKMEEG